MIAVLVALLTTLQALPNPALTPGDTLSSDTAIVCRPLYATNARARLTKWQWLSRRRVVRSRYGVALHAPVQIDHLIPLELGGSNAVTNLWPEPYPSAYQKDSVEGWLHRQACSGHIPLRTAQTTIATDWRVAYRAMHGKRPTTHHTLTTGQ